MFGNVSTSDHVAAVIKFPFYCSCKIAFSELCCPVEMVCDNRVDLWFATKKSESVTYHVVGQHVKLVRHIFHLVVASVEKWAEFKQGLDFDST